MRNKKHNSIFLITLFLMAGLTLFAVICLMFFNAETENKKTETESTQLTADAVPTPEETVEQEETKELEETEEPEASKESECPEPPHFVMLSDRKYKTGTGFSLNDLVYAEDAKGQDITDRIIIASDGGFDPDRKGSYEVTYSVTDDDQITAEETITVFVGSFEKNDYGFTVDRDAISFLISHGYFGYDALAGDEAEDINALTELTSPTSFGAAYDDGACSCFLYRVTEDYLFFFTNKHCPVDSAETLCIYDCYDNMTEIPSGDIIYIKCHPEWDAVANGYLQYDQQMFAVPISYFDLDELLMFREVHIDPAAFKNLKAGDMFLMNTQSWRRCQKDIVLENTVMSTDCYEKTAYHYDEDEEKRISASSHMVVGEMKNAVGSCSGSPCFDKYGNFLGFIWGTTYADGPELIYLDQFVPLTYFLEFADSVDYSVP